MDVRVSVDCCSLCGQKEYVGLVIHTTPTRMLLCAVVGVRVSSVREWQHVGRWGRRGPRSTAGAGQQDASA